MIFKEAELDIDPEAGGTSSHFFFEFAVPLERFLWSWRMSSTVENTND
jgi:hypothetical protein